MNINLTISTRAAVVLWLAVYSQSRIAFAQGNLTPPGAPSPTMKTLQQIEPRVPISSLPYVITNPGSYYITANLAGVTGSNGITVTVNNVDLDLMGFTLTGASGSGDGVGVYALLRNISVRNGNLQNWGGYGVNGTNITSGRLARVRAFGNAGGGLALGDRGAVDDCEVTSNLWNGVVVGGGSRVNDCVAYGNGKGGYGSGIVGTSNVVVNGCTCMLNWKWGIALSNDCRISASTANLNSTFGPYSGILAGSGCVIRGCTANDNQRALAGAVGHGIVSSDSCIIKECTTINNNIGISAGVACNVIDCIANHNSVNAGEGIVVKDSCLVRGCVASANSYGGILYKNKSFVFDNLCSSTTIYGYPDVYGFNATNSAVVHNLLGSTNFLLFQNNPTNNLVGELETATRMNTNKNPHANFTH